jgi:structural maintenance of chromosome 2
MYYSFDPHFNAITGLNGSGKSNILDAICFVLGITNLSQVRAGNLSELVYKQGQAGVNKATVTIIFNNEDESSSPVGYEQCPQVTVTRQVLIGGKSKYLINGRNAPANQVQNLFHSVQLNVNNPHFLIMQGRITKVLNMKPHEILGMVEEAAGTRMYETKRVGALKTIEKKQLKLDELNAVLAEEITPTLERLRGEKQSYLKWSKNNADMERIERFVIANEFMQAQKALDNNTEGSAEMEEQVAILDDKTSQIRELIVAKEREIEERSSSLKGEFENSHNEAKVLEEQRSKDLVKITSSWKNAKTNVTKAESDLDAARSLVTETKQAVVAKESDIATESQSIEHKILAAKEAEERLARLTLDYQNMSAGISSTEGDEGRTLPEQISKAHSDSKSAEAKVQQASMKMKHLSKELKVCVLVDIFGLVFYPFDSRAKLL